MKRVLLAGLLGGVVMFIWGWLSWGMLPWHNATIPNLPNEDAVIAVLQSSITASAVYQFPGMPAGEADMAAWTEKYKRGPSGMLFYSVEGKDPMGAGMFVGGFILEFIIATLAAWFLSLALGRLPGYGQRVGFLTMLGVLGALVSHIMAWNWMGNPMGYSLVMSADLVIASLLAGLVIAWRIKPEMAA